MLYVTLNCTLDGIFLVLFLVCFFIFAIKDVIRTLVIIKVCGLDNSIMSMLISWLS